MKLFKLLCLVAIAIQCSMATYVFQRGKWFDRIFIVIFENEGFTEVESDLNWSYVASQGRLLTSYLGITHPSQPNYWALVAGTDFDYLGWPSNPDAIFAPPTSGDSHTTWNVSHVGDLLDAGQISWRTYQEDYPCACYMGNCGSLYMRKHNPFISFVNVFNNSTRCQNTIVNSTQIIQDIQNNNLPQYMFYTPNMLNDGHDTNVAYTGTFLRGFYDNIITQLPSGTLTLLSWDEDNVPHVIGDTLYTILIGSMIPPGSSDSTSYNHYSVLRTVELNWNLGNLGQGDVGAVPIVLPPLNKTIAAVTPTDPNVPINPSLTPTNCTNVCLTPITAPIPVPNSAPTTAPTSPTGPTSPSDGTTLMSFSFFSLYITIFLLERFFCFQRL